MEPLPAVELNNDIVSLQDEERREVIAILRELTGRVGDRADDLSRTAAILGELDAVQAMALVARDMEASTSSPRVTRCSCRSSPSASAWTAGRAASRCR